MKSRLILAGAVAAVVSLAGLASSTSVASGPASAGRQAAPVLRYVALGDSYSAASGVVPIDPTAPQCLRSTLNYPSVIGAEIGADVVDVTCGAAETGDYFTEQYPGTAPQLDALNRNTQLITMTIGGNDSNVFVGAVLSCGVAGLSTLGTGSPCKDQYGDSFEKTVRTKTYPSLVKALTAVHQKSPRARVAILGYPRILPSQGGCFPQMPVAEGDVPYLYSLQLTLNDAVERAAKKTGTVYVDVPAASAGHDACQAIGTRWVEPVLLGTNPVIVHPNALGEAKMAALTVKKLGLRR